MKLRYFVTGLLLTVAGLTAKSQVFEMYYQGFETSEPVRFSVAPQTGYTYDSNIKKSGDNSLKLMQSSTSDVVLISDTLDFTQNTTLRYIALEFDHICTAYKNGGENTNVCLIWYKRANQSDNNWTKVTGTMQNQSVDYSSEFSDLSSFYRLSYGSEWEVTTPTNDLWHSARFDLDNALPTGLSPDQRKLIIKLEIKQKTTSTNQVGAWWIDNLRVRSSQNQMVNPKINMRIYPDGGLLPSSRDAKVSFKASTTVAQGICADSVYVVYTVGSDPTERRIYATPSTVASPGYGTETRYTARIPFCGYDTLMRFYCVVKDNTTNHNMITYPAAMNSWIEYRHVRGVSQPGEMNAAFNAPSSEGNFPFPQFCDARSEWVYDSAFMAQAGYGPGAMTAMRYRITANNLSQTHPRFQLRLKNVPTNYTRIVPETGGVPFMGTDKYPGYMQAVYDSTYVIEEVGAGTERTIDFQDTFYYAGKDLLVQVIYDGTTDSPGKTFIATMPICANKKSIFYFGGEANFNFNTYTSTQTQTSTDASDKRPMMIMTTHKNLPLVYDMGVSAIAFPNETNPMLTQPSHIDVVLKNFGVATINGASISYVIDDSISGSYEWSGSLNGGDSMTVTVATGISLPAGYHTVCAWTEDSLTVDSTKLRDHEPLNNTSCSEYIVCEGPMHGVRYVGCDSADYNNINEALFSLSQCGVDDSIVLKVATCEHHLFATPVIPGISASNYVAIEPVAGDTVTIKTFEDSTYLVDLSNTPYIRLRNLNFVRTSYALTNMIVMGPQSTNCRVEKCTFTDNMSNPPSAYRIESMINTGFANNVLIEGCTFNGGGIGVNVAGQATDSRSHDNVVRGNLFYNQYTSAVIVGNQSRVTVERNEMYNVMSNASYVLRLLQCDDSVRVYANKIYTSHGAQALGVSGMTGSQYVPALIANNMVVCEDDGSANQQNTPFNIIAGDWIDIVFNSVKLVAPERANVAAATLGGGNNISNCRFVNNIVACFDNSNYAFNFIPGNQTSNIIGHNVYYSEGYTLNKRTGSNYHTIEMWQQAVPMDSTSVKLNPGYLNGSLVDLRTFNRLVKGLGTPIATVPTDMFDTLRNATAPCPGAFEFVSLYYDFEIEALLNPQADNCFMPDNVELVIAIRNSGINGYTPGGSVPLSMGYSVNGDTPLNFSVPRSVPGEDTAVIFTGHTLNLPPDGIHDATHHVKVWVSSPNDPNQTNDTTVFDVISRYHFDAPTDITHSIPYNTADTIEVTDGITQWDVYGMNELATPIPSNIYWYLSPDDTEPFHSGTTYMTNVLQQDTHFYVRQKREIPIVRITQVQLFRADTVVGLANPMPEWIHPNTPIIVQLTNVGDDTAYLENDSVLFVSPTSAANNKFIKFGAGVTIAPGASLAIQFYGGNVTLTDQLPYMVQKKQLPTITPATNFGIVYRSHGVKDAVAFNNITTATQWTNLHVPPEVWHTDGIPLADTIDSLGYVPAGFIRLGWNGGQQDWFLPEETWPMSFATRPMFGESWTRYTPNQCLGAVGVVTINMSNPPSVDLVLTTQEMPTGCGLGNEPLSVSVYNNGVGTASGVQVNYQVNDGPVVTETIGGTIAAHTDTLYTFLQPIDMIVDDDSLFNITIWATHVTGDPLAMNDTCSVSTVASHTPELPIFSDTLVANYGVPATFTLISAGEVLPVWYNYEGVPIDTGYTCTTDVLYSEGEMGVSYLHKKDSLVHIGNLANLIGKTAYPNPYQPNNKSSKQQYIYSAYELRSMGLQPGEISGVAFHLDSIYKVNNNTQRDSVVFNSYDIYLGLTTDTIFANTTAWKTTTQVYSRTNMPIYRSSSHDWVMHQLDTGFMWDGVQSLVVQVVTEINTAITTGVQTSYTAKPNTTLHKAQNTAVGAGFTAAGTKGNNRPDIIFIGKINGCEGAIKPFYVSLDGVPDVDAALLMPTESGDDAVVYNSCGNVNMVVGMRNMGRNTIQNYQLHYSVDGEAVDTTFINDSVVGGAATDVTLFSRPLMPGRHTVVASISVDGDTVPGNDSLRFSFNVRFCSGDYTIGADSIYDYHSFAEAIDTLGVAGIDGTVVFHVAPGVYNEQVQLGAIQGSSMQNMIVFRGSGDSVSTIMAANTAAANYVLKIDGLSNVVFDSMHIVSRTPSGNNGHVVSLQSCSNVTLQNCEIVSCGRINNQNASCVVLQGNVDNLTLDGNVLDSGYFSITTMNNATGFSGFAFRNNIMRNFKNGGVNIVGLSAIEMTRNEIRSSNKSKLTAVKLENVDSMIVIQKNKIYLVAADNTDNLGKRGLELKNVSGTNQQWAYVMNNMIGVHSNGVSSLASAGIFIDGASSYINVYYNSVRVYAGPIDATQSKAFYTNTQTNHIQVLNNIFSNFSNSYAYYVTSSSNVTSSDYNVYYAAGEKLAYWASAERPTLTDLQVANSRDGSSLFEEPYFFANDDLHLATTSFKGLAQYNTDVIDDIDDTIRQQIPAPTIGAHELIGCTHDMAVVRIISPTMPVAVTVPNDVESDPVMVKVTFFNNGDAYENNVRWRAYVVGHEEEIATPVRNLGTFASGQMKTDSVLMPTVLGIIDTQTLRVELIYDNDSCDCDTVNNSRSTQFYLAPAYDFEVVRLTVPSGCELQHSEISITLKNVGFKDIPAGVDFEIGYHAQAYHPSIQISNLNNNRLDIATIPDTVIETHSFATPLARNASRDVVFNTTANLYPTDTALNIKVRVNGWCRYQYDVAFANDSSKLASSSSPQIESWFTPDAPVGNDTTFQYGTWGEVTASQVNNRPIRWHRDSTAAPFFTGNNYNLSRKWSTTPQYFHDSTYYLQCISDKGCSSHFSAVHVHVYAQEPNDVGIRMVHSPLGARVYMENDTVRVRIENYGTNTQTSIPVVYQMRSGNNTNPIQEVHDTCRVPIAPNQYYDFTFDTLLHFANPLQSATYQLRVWTDLENDAARRNDTIRMVNQLRPSSPNNTTLDYVFTARGNGGNSYSGSQMPFSGNGLDFRRIAFNEIDIDLPPLGRRYTNFAHQARPGAVFPNTEIPVLRVTRGMVDTLIVNIINPEDQNERTRGKVVAYIDFDRSGDFEDDPLENVYPVNPLETDQTLKTAVEIPNTASLGYMKMRVIVAPYETNPNSTMTTSNGDLLAGHMVDFLLYVEPETPARDIALTMIDAPRNYLIRDTSAVAVSFRMANKGTQAFSGDLAIHYRFDNDTVDSLSTGIYMWHGTLEPGRSTIVRLPRYRFHIGTTDLTIWHEDPNDTILYNNQLQYQYHRFHTIILRVNEFFDDSNHWYAPVGYNNYTRNYWQAGTPSKNNIIGAYSEPNAWVTDTVSSIVSGIRGNVSYLYSPIINIAQIRPDTMSFRLLRNLEAGSSLRIEYYDYENNWVNLVDDNLEMLADGTWYSEDDLAFVGTSTGGAYNRVWCSTGPVKNDFNENLQFRFVYTTPQGSNENSSYGDGAAIDDFRIGRARRNSDLGVIAITQPTMPKYGQTLYPEVVVKNYGTDTVFSVQVGYNFYGTSLARISNFSCVIPPNEVDTFLCTSPFIVTSDFPDTFNITAFTIWTADIYDDNDTNTRLFALSPLDNDISAEEFIAPLDRVIAGDSTCTVTLRVRNFGLNPIDSAVFAYSVNGEAHVEESASFIELLGRPLQSMEYFNYTFQHQFLAAMGMMNVEAYVKCDSNQYLYNDTINKRILGISSITDLAAASIIVDTTAIDAQSNLRVGIQLVIENRGARGANDFEVGFWIDNDTSTIVREVYRRDMPLPALTTGFYYFDTLLMPRSAPYSYVTAFVHVLDDNDPTNDTTTFIVSKFVDIEAVDIIVEENASPDCRVFARVRNVGNTTFLNRRLKINNTQVNGNELTFNSTLRIDALQTYRIEFSSTIPKDPQRHYAGSLQINVTGDPVENNQSSVVRVVNYVENVPEVGAGQLVLDQNYPNPFSGQTTIPFSLPNAAHVRFFVMDAMGHIVNTIEGNYPAGNNSITLQMDRYATGVYYYGIEVDGVRQMRKMILR